MGENVSFFSIFLLVCLFVCLFVSFFEDLTFNNVRGTHWQFIGDKIVFSKKKIKLKQQQPYAPHSELTCGSSRVLIFL